MLTKTYTLELLSIIAINCPNSIEIVKSNYTIRGVEARIKDKFDEQEYKLIIERVEND